METEAACWVLDFDRCLGGQALYDDAYEALRTLPADTRERIAAIQQKTEAEGGSFDLVSYLEEHEPETTDTFLEAYRRITKVAGPQRYRNDGATELLATLAHRGTPFMILTYGGKKWQEAKLAAAGLDSIPYLVTDRKDKGTIIAGWYDETAAIFAVPSSDGTARRFRQIVLVDDKATAFIGLPEEAKGYWFRPDNSPLRKSQDGEIPDNVTAISTLQELVGRIS